MEWNGMEWNGMEWRRNLVFRHVTFEECRSRWRCLRYGYEGWDGGGGNVEN